MSFSTEQVCVTDLEDILSDSPAEFDSSFAYALHGEMRRLLIVTILGTVLYPFGLGLLFHEQSSLLTEVLGRGTGLDITLVGAAFLFGGIVAVLFKTIVDANTVAAGAARAETENETGREG